MTKHEKLSPEFKKIRDSFLTLQEILDRAEAMQGRHPFFNRSAAISQVLETHSRLVGGLENTESS